VATEPESIMPCGILAYPVGPYHSNRPHDAGRGGFGAWHLLDGGFSQDKVKTILGIPEKLKVVSLLTLGYPDETGRPKTRKTLKEIICWEKYEPFSQE